MNKKKSHGIWGILIMSIISYTVCGDLHSTRKIPATGNLGCKLKGLYVIGKNFFLSNQNKRHNFAKLTITVF